MIDTPDVGQFYNYPQPPAIYQPYRLDITPNGRGWLGVEPYSMDWLLIEPMGDGFIIIKPFKLRR